MVAVEGENIFSTETLTLIKDLTDQIRAITEKRKGEYTILLQRVSLTDDRN